MASSAHPAELLQLDCFKGTGPPRLGVGPRGPWGSCLPASRESRGTYSTAEGMALSPRGLVSGVQWWQVGLTDRGDTPALLPWNGELPRILWGGREQSLRPVSARILVGCSGRVFSQRQYT